MSNTPRNLVEVARQSAEQFADRKAIGTRADDGWVWLTYREVGDLVERFRAGLASLGVGPGDRVGIVSRNRLEWVVACYATVGLGAALVPMYEHQRPAEWAFILADAGAKVVIAGNADIAGELARSRPGIPTLRHVISLEPSPDPDSFQSLIAYGAEHPVPPREVDPDTCAMFVYTSGTTGQPKGVMLSHANLLVNVNSLRVLFPLGEGDISLSFLPWAHSFGQAELHVGMSMGGAVALNADPTRLLDDMAEVRPTLLVTVPRVFNRLYEKVQHEMAGKPALIQRLFHAGVQAAIERGRGHRIGLWRRIELFLADRLIFAKIRRLFGGRLRAVVSGAAPLSREVGEFIHALGLPVYEGYGLSETSPLVSLNYPGNNRLGSTGKPAPGIRVDIDMSVAMPGEDGEIIVHGPNVMLGYHQRPEENARVFTADGGLRTGDLGHIDDAGYIYVTGRIKEQYKLDTGKYVVPSPLEERLQISPYITSAMIYGDGRPFNVALIVPQMPAIQELLDKEEVAPQDREARIRTLIGEEIATRSQDFRSFEVPRRFALLPRDFSVEDDTMTPTFKLKRRNVVARYREVIDALYVEEPQAIAPAPPANLQAAEPGAAGPA